MKLSQQVCSLEQGLRLQELGITGPALFWYSALKSGSHQPVIQYGYSSGCLAPAFTVAELGQMLPESMNIGRNNKHKLRFHRTDNPFGEDRPLWFSEPMINVLFGSPEHTTEAFMKGELLIYLLDNYHINSEEANKRLNHE